MTDLDRPTPASYWVVPGRLLAGEYAGSQDEEQTRQRMAAFLDAGFDTFFDLTTEGELPPYLPILMEEANTRDRRSHYGSPTGYHYQRFPIRDEGLPSTDTMLAILEAIDTAIAWGRKVYLHCWGGIGRTGTVVGCYLVHQGLNGKTALQRLKELYRPSEQFVFFPYVPETDEQVAFVLQWGTPSPPPLPTGDRGER
jgi:hypothetical protein